MNDMAEAKAKSGLGTADIIRVLKLLPHRYPFLMLDRIYDMDGDESCVGVKNVTINEPFFQGHFPQYPGDAGRADHRGPGADGRRAVRAQPRRGLQGRARLLHGHRPRQVPQAGAAGRSAPLSRAQDPQPRPRLALLRRSARSTARSSPKPRSAPCWPIPPRQGRSRQANMAEMRIHPTAVVEAGATLGDGVKIGPYCVVGPDVDAGRRRRAAQPRRRRRRAPRSARARASSPSPPSAISRRT